MGALHAGHLSLVKRARDENDIAVVSIFVNPIQFGREEDFEKYPRDVDGDMDKLREAGVDILFMPDATSVYPDGFSTHISVEPLSSRLCGLFRPGHFTGVSTVVCKLFNMVAPTRSYFGQKDFQQTVVIKRMIMDLNLGVEAVVCPTVRESDGLAMSSRNEYLSPDERNAAAVIYRTLMAASEMIKSNGASPETVRNEMTAMLRSEPLITEIQYAGVYDAASLEDLAEFGDDNLLAIAVKLGGTRLIDNVLVELKQ
jgi:pantoate--beta-alanine ligase